MKHFDLFSGYGGFSLALKKVYEKNITLQGNRSSRPEHGGSSQSLLPRGINMSPEKPSTIGFSEIDKYASAVLKKQWPNIKNYGDIKKINWSEVPDFDLLTGGSPCQDLSIAGKRAGLEGERSGLFYEYMRAVREKKPKYFIWENVKGALSSSKGFDFGSVLNEMAEAGYSLWWQVLNAKDFGVPQNRERIFVVGFRDGSPREVFFERPSNEETNFNIIGNTNNCGRGERGRIFGDDKLVSGLTATDYKQPKQILQLNNPTHSNNRVYGEDGISPTINTAQGGNRQPFIKAVLTPDRLEKRQNGRRFKENGEPSFTLTSQDKHGIYNGSRIRRLTPTECERLMGLPDGWTSKGIMKNEEVEISDSQRYKMCGNGVVVNVVEELLKQIII